ALSFLSRGDVVGLLELTFPGHHFPPTLAAQLHTRTEGNPLFARELLRNLHDSGAICQGPDGWILAGNSAELDDLPDSLRGLIERKLERLQEQDRQLLLAAAVQGVEFDTVVVAKALGRDPADVEDCLAALDREHALLRVERERELASGELSLRCR